jgi:hypothetical protein
LLLGSFVFGRGLPILGVLPNHWEPNVPSIRYNFHFGGSQSALYSGGTSISGLLKIQNVTWIGHFGRWGCCPMKRQDIPWMTNRGHTHACMLLKDWSPSDILFLASFLEHLSKFHPGGPFWVSSSNLRGIKCRNRELSAEIVRTPRNVLHVP